MPRAQRWPAACAVAALALAACSSSSPSKVSTGATTVTTAPASPAVATTTTAPSPPTTGAPLVGGGVTPVTTPSQGHAKLTAIRVGDQGGFDRVTFAFSDGLPGYSVKYVARPIQEDPT